MAMETAQALKKTVRSKPAPCVEIITPKKQAAPTVRRSARGLRKDYLAGKNRCKVTFKLPRAAAPHAERVCIAGDFNDWDTDTHVMKKLKSGVFTITLELLPEREYQFRYLVDGTVWVNDWHADKYVKCHYGGCDNSVVVV